MLPNLPADMRYWAKLEAGLTREFRAGCQFMACHFDSKSWIHLADASKVRKLVAVPCLGCAVFSLRDCGNFLQHQHMRVSCLGSASSSPRMQSVPTGFSRENRTWPAGTLFFFWSMLILADIASLWKLHVTPTMYSPPSASTDTTNSGGLGQRLLDSAMEQRSGSMSKYVPGY